MIYRLIQNKYLSAVAGILILSAFMAHSQDLTGKSIPEKLGKAEELYYEGFFTDAVTIISECLLNENIKEEEQKQAYKLLANISLAQEKEAEAKNNIRKLLTVDPAYAPTIEQETPQFVNLVNEVKAGMEKEKPKKRTWLYIGAGATTVAAVVTYFIIKGNSSNGGNGEEPVEQPLAMPPVWPVEP